MKLSFDGIRMTLAAQFNDLAETELSFDQRQIMHDLRMTVGGLLAAYDERDQPDDCNMLADEIKLARIVLDDEDEE